MYKKLIKYIGQKSSIPFMLLAVVFHISRGETSIIGLRIIIILIAAFIAWDRFSKFVISPKFLDREENGISEKQ